MAQAGVIGLGTASKVSIGEAADSTRYETMNIVI